MVQFQEDPEKMPIEDPTVKWKSVFVKVATIKTSFTEQAFPIRRKLEGIPRFVWARGGAYFFMPGLKALKFLGRSGN